jgi:hypothetical protein
MSTAYDGPDNHEDPDTEEEDFWRWWDCLPDDEDICEYCDGTGLSDKWDEESFCIRCNGMGYNNWLPD